jgi:alpha-glucosidase (family GH31 glycosyl hydrolase)
VLLSQDTLRLRSALGPYLYTEARRAYDTGLIATHPTYIDWPEDPASYTADGQYMFGGVLLAAPVWDANATVNAPWLSPSANATTPAALGGYRSVYLPPAPAWSDWNGTHVYSGGANLTGVFYALNDSPLFALAGAIIPLALPSGAANSPDPLCLVVFPVSEGTSLSSYTLYEDDGNSNSALNGGTAFAWTQLNATVSLHNVTVSVGATTGTFEGALQSRGIEVHLRGFNSRAVSPVLVTANSLPVPEGAGPGCAPCWWLAQPVAHSLVLPAGTLVIEAGRWETNTSGVVVVFW